MPWLELGLLAWFSSAELILSIQFSFYLTNLPSGFSTWPNFHLLFTVGVCGDQDVDQGSLLQDVDQEFQDDM
jgi:hypothetical protein